MKRFNNRYIRLTEHPILLVGEAPGKQRPGQQNFDVFHGNRSGDFIEECIKGVDNIVLTNACMYLDFKFGVIVKPKNYSDYMQQVFLFELENLITVQQPSKIITLGNVAHRMITEMKKFTDQINFPHPSWVLRFNKNVEQYKKQLINELTQRIPANP